MDWIFCVRGEGSHFIENSLAVRIAETDRVLAVNPSVSVLRSPSSIGIQKRIFKPDDSRVEIYYRPLHFPVRVPIMGPAFKSLNNRLFCREMGQLAKTRPDVFCVRSPEQYPLIGLLKEPLSLYSASDDYTVNLEGRPIPGEMERERCLLEKIDQVFCVSEVLANRLRERAPCGKHLPIHIVPNFYNERIFNLNTIRSEPAVLQGVPRPRILVAGHISERIDWDGITAVSSLRPEWHWVFLGRVTEPPMKERIRQFGPRAFLFPGVSFYDVPSWIQYSDACAIPYRLNAFTLASDPIKAPEYLAMGAPVLSTRIPSLSRFNKAIYWVEEGNAESYAAALDAIQADSGRQEVKMFRQKAVEADSLDVRAQQFAATIRAQL
ncbi:MAG: glycosyltransferase [Acidobacteria bacterium]|nr:glycosyltransferase [Acidobacteriota bacterium]